MRPHLLAVLALASPTLAPEETLQPGTTVTGTFASDAELIATTQTADRWGSDTTRGIPYAFAPGAGTWTLELRAGLFDPYLIVLDERGELVAEDDDGLGGIDARLVLELDAGDRVTVWACAKHLGLGEFELRAVEGDAPLPERTEEEDLASFVARVVASHDLGTQEGADAIYRRASELRAEKRNQEALELLDRALAELDLDRAGHERTSVRFASLRVTTLIRLRDYRQAVAWGLGIASLYREHLTERNQSVYAQSMAYAMWREGLYAEGLAFAEHADELARRLVETDSRDFESVRGITFSFQRSNGRWDPFLATVGEPVTLRAGEQLDGRIEITSNRYQATDVLTNAYSPSPARFTTIPFRVETSGDYTIDLRSCSFDGYLVLRDMAGAVVAEDDDGRGIRNARIVTRLEAGTTYLLEPSALHNGSGRYFVELLAGRPHPMSEWDMRQLRLADARACEALLEETGGEALWENVIALRHIVLLLDELGRTEEIVGFRERELEMVRELAGRGSVTETGAMRLLADALRRAGRGVEAVELIEEVYERSVAQLGPDRLQSSLFVSLAWCRSSRGDFERAERLLDQAERAVRAARGEDHIDFVAVLGERAALAHQQGRWQAAAEIGERIVQWHVAHGAAENPGAHYLLAKALHDLALRQSVLGDCEAARRNYDEAIRLRSLVYGENSRVVAVSRLYYSWALGRLAETDLALQAWSAACEVLEPANEYVDVCWGFGAELYASAGDWERALELAKRGIERRTQLTARYLATLPEPARLRELVGGRWFAGLVDGIGARVTGREREVYETLLPQKGLVNRGLIESRASVRAAMTPQTRATVEELRAVQSELAAAFHSRSEILLENLHEQRLQLEDELARHQDAPGTAEEITLGALVGALPRDAVLVDFHVTTPLEPARIEDGELVAPEWWQTERVTAWIVRGDDDSVARVDLGPLEVLEQAAWNPAGEMGAARGVRVEAKPEEASDASALRRLLWDPIAPHVGSAPLVFVSPYGFLGAVPFEVFRRDDGAFLVEDHRFVYLTDVATLLEPAPKPPSNASSLLLVGDVDYDSRDAREGADRPAPSFGALAMLRGAGATGWNRLPFTAREVDRVATLFEGRTASRAAPTILSGAAATEEAVERALSSHAYVHVATHGFFQPEGTTSLWDSARAGALGSTAEVAGLLPGLLSGLVFAGANLEPEPDREDGLLTAEELTWLDLSRCELVTLSACETGLGSARGGEGLIGLRRAFRQAGAKTVVASLWAVEDAATSRLMDAFYRYLWTDGLPRSEALRAAQLDLLSWNLGQHGEPRPWTWGAFVLTGEWR